MTAWRNKLLLALDRGFACKNAPSLLYLPQVEHYVPYNPRSSVSHVLLSVLGQKDLGLYSYFTDCCVCVSSVHRLNGGLPQTGPANTAGAEEHRHPAPHQLHQGDKCSGQRVRGRMHHSRIKQAHLSSRRNVCFLRLRCLLEDGVRGKKSYSPRKERYSCVSSNDVADLV